MSTILTAMRMRAEPVNSLAFGSISGTYAAVGNPFLNPSRMLLVQNLTDQSMMFSFDGVNDNFPLVSNGLVIFDFCTNRSDRAGAAFMVANTQVYVKQLSGGPTVNGVYVTTFFAAST